MPQDPPTPVRTSAAGLFLLALLALAACSQPVVADRREPAAGPVIACILCWRHLLKTKQSEPIIT